MSTSTDPILDTTATFDSVTFDCWGTLIYEVDGSAGKRARAAIFAEAAQHYGRDIDEAEAAAILARGWDRHWAFAAQGRVTDSFDMATWALQALDLDRPERRWKLGHTLGSASLQQEIVPLAGAAETLEALARQGTRIALICDTGFSPGYVVREILDRHGLLKHLEVQIFSNETGIPKPNIRAFHSALSALGVDPCKSAHVGDRLATDILGGQRVGMSTIRIKEQLDDPADLPDANHVVHDHLELQTLLGLR